MYYQALSEYSVAWLTTDIFQCKLTQICHFSQAFGSVDYCLAVWYFLFFFRPVWQRNLEFGTDVSKLAIFHTASHYAVFPAILGILKSTSGFSVLRLVLKSDSDNEI